MKIRKNRETDPPERADSGAGKENSGPGRKKDRSGLPGKGRSILPGAVLAALAASVIIYVVMLNVEKNALSDYEKGPVLTAVKEIPEGQVITAENAGEYVRAVEMDRKLISETAPASAEELAGLLALHGIAPGTILYREMFQPLDEITGAMEQPVIASFKAEDLYQVTGGILRTGDRIHIYTVAPENHDTQLVWQDVFVQQVFDSSGSAIMESDSTTAASRVNILIEKESVEAFYTSLASGSLRVVREW